MAITQKSIKILWSAAAGLCSFPNCEERLTYAQAGEFAPYTLGEMAHICGEKQGSNRYAPNQTPKERDDYLNLILLCPLHHTLIDRRENERRFPKELIHRFKDNHEVEIGARLIPKTPGEKEKVVATIKPLLMENHAAWASYGPTSELARANPHSDSAYAVWLSERLSTIVPNNRRIIELLNAIVTDLSEADLKIISLFQLHARSYERWVLDEIDYDGVTRFPNEFFDLMMGNRDGGV